jgi:cytochrome c-type biogenesis protein
MTDAPPLGLATAFAAGIVSLRPSWVLPLVPAFVSYVAGESLHDAQRRPDANARISVMVLSALFVTGFSAVFIALGGSASALGRLLPRHRYEANIGGGVIVMVFAMAMLGLAQRIPWFYRDVWFHPRLRGGSPAGALVPGLAFGFGWTPCIGPVFGAILTVSAAQSSVCGGVALRSAYALGLGVPFLLSALFAGATVGRLKKLRCLGVGLQIAAGVIMVLIGLAMVTGRLTTFGYWLLETFPTLGRI